MDHFIPIKHSSYNGLKKRNLIRKFGIKLKNKTRRLAFTEQLMREQSNVEVVPVNQVVDLEPRVRIEGNTVVIPICEEIIVKRVLIREEIRVTKQKTSIPYSDIFVIRNEKARIIREVKNLWPLKRLLRSFRY
jgi:hypothetical protein